MKIKHFHHQGQRTYQEDNLYMDNVNGLFIICDGVGGNNAGATASKLVIQIIVELFEDYDYAVDDKALYKIIKATNKRLYKIANKEVSQMGMATTLALVYLFDDFAYFAHIGDSRIYFFSIDSNSYWVSKDHSVVQELYDAEVLKSELAMKMHPYNNRITKSIIASEKYKEMEPSIKIQKSIIEKDCILLCSDGALESFTSKELIKHFTNTDVTMESRWKIYQDHCFENSKDNNTAILIEI